MNDDCERGMRDWTSLCCRRARWKRTVPPRAKEGPDTPEMPQRGRGSSRYQRDDKYKRGERSDGDVLVVTVCDHNSPFL